VKWQKRFLHSPNATKDPLKPFKIQDEPLSSHHSFITLIISFKETRIRHGEAKEQKQEPEQASA
jgi:hypothetical protein